MKKENIPYFSIVTISYNQGIYLQKCIESILNQTFEDFEYIIQDPGSKDNSREIISGFSYDSRLKYYFEEDESPGDGLNKGFSKAKGHYFLFLNSDDELCLDALENLYIEIINNPGFDVYSGSAMIIDSDGRLLRLTYSDNMNLRRASFGECILVQPSTVFKESIYRKVGGFNKDNLISWDGELFIDFAISSARFKTFKKVISKYRITSTSITGSGLYKLKSSKEKRRLFKKIYKKNPPKFFKFFSLFYRILRKVFNIQDTLQRIIYGKISGRFSNK